MNWIAIAWSGFVAIVFAATLFWLFRSLGATMFSPSQQLGCLFFRNPVHPGAETLGFFLLLVLGTTAVPAVYSLIFDWLAGPSLGAGLVVGAVHGFLAAAALPWLGTISACVRARAFPAPGMFGINWGRLTPVALLVGHGLYGGIYGAVLAKF